MLGDRVRTLVAKRVKLIHECLAFDLLARSYSPRQLPYPKGRQQQLRGRTRGRHQKLRLLALRLKCIQGRQPLGHYAEGRGRTIVWQAVPARQCQHLNVRCK